MHGNGIGGSVSAGWDWQITQTSYISVNRFSSGNLQGWIDVTVMQSELSHDWCGKIFSILGAIGGAISGIGGGFFGLVGASCGS
jgi:hypothetical protein